jgi:hypothetical protein
MDTVFAFLVVTVLCVGLFYLLYAVPLGLFGDDFMETDRGPPPREDDEPPESSEV